MRCRLLGPIIIGIGLPVEYPRIRRVANIRIRTSLKEVLGALVQHVPTRSLADLPHVDHVEESAVSNDRVGWLTPLSADVFTNAVRVAVLVDAAVCMGFQVPLEPHPRTLRDWLVRER